MLPKDPFVLFSYVNTKLRDEYASLDEFCEDQQLDRAVLEKLLAGVGFSYDSEKNCFR